MEMSLTFSVLIEVTEGTDNIYRQGAQFMVSYFLHKDKKHMQLKLPFDLKSAKE